MSGPCARCGRTVTLRGRAPEGPICSNCCAQRHSGTCAHCSEQRRLDGRDPEGRPWCARCRDRQRRTDAEADWRRQVLEAVAAVEPLPAGTIASAVDRAVSSARAIRWLANHLAQHPDVLTVGPTNSPPVLDRLVRELDGAGAQRVHVIHPTCASCGRLVRPHARVGNGWLCSACWARQSKRRCAVCGQIRGVYRRDAKRRPICAGCAGRAKREDELAGLSRQIVAAMRAVEPRLASRTIGRAVEQVAPDTPRRRQLAHAVEMLTDGQPQPAVVAHLLNRLRAAGAAKLPATVCHACGARTHEPTVLGRSVLCPDCARLCPACGRRARLAGESICRRCRGDRHHSRGTCDECGHDDRRLDDQRRCRACRDRDNRRCSDCGSQEPLTGGRCYRCTLERLVESILGPPLPGPLDALRSAIESTRTPQATLRWLTNERTTEILAAASSTHLSHETLDSFGTGPAVEHLRAMLVAANLLAVDVRPLARLQAAAAEIISGVDGADRAVIKGWANWSVLPRIRRRADQGKDLTNSAANARRSLLEVTRLLINLHGRGQTLATCTQGDLDAWFAQPGVAHHAVRPFLAWAQRRKHLPGGLIVPACRRQEASQLADPEERWTLARRLVVDDELDPADRFAAALVVLYAQPLARIVTLTRQDVSHDGSTIQISLGPERIELPEPLGSLSEQLPIRRRGGVSDHLPNPWLFPGGRAGQHMTATALGDRLRAIGVQPRRFRLAALSQLANEVPPAMLAPLLGVNANTAVRWAALSGGDWAKYSSSHRDMTS